VNEAAIRVLPKAELHLHIEGTLEPEMMLEFAARNGISLPYSSVADLYQAYNFSNLQTFLNIYYAGMSVLRTESDFQELADAYFRRAAQAGVVHAELSFDPQAHIERGVSFQTVIDGLWAAVNDSSAKYGVSSRLILCFLRDRTAEDALATLEAAVPFGARIVAVGLDSAELGHPPSKFAAVFERARSVGWKTVAHAGEEAPPAYVWEALDALQVARIDHGVRSMEDPRLVERLRRERVPLTVCPISNVKLRVVDCLEDHPLPEMLAAGLCVTVNSDDPAYFRSYLDDSFAACTAALDLRERDIVTLARNSIEAAFMSEEERRRHLASIDDVVLDLS
jgi:adenosine deaminase